ncbi:MAG: PQQ-dependent sugar dehydrogenase, partial [Ignavibacteria bacterium]
MNILLNSFIAVFFFFTAGCSDKKKEVKLEQVNSKKSEYLIEVFVKDLEVPWSIIFTSDSRVLVNERPGRLRIIENGRLLPEPLKTFDEVSNNSEEGLMGLALDPNYDANKLIYMSYAYKNDGDLQVKVVRYKDNGNSISFEKLIIDNLPAAQYHAGCRLKFGPDKKLYITTGDAGDRKFAQDLNKMNGKILRVNNDGTIPVDNPFPNSPVWTYGHRNPQGIDWV